MFIPINKSLLIMVKLVLAGIEEFPETHRRLVTVKKGDTAVIECTLPHSNPPALPRYRIRGKWLEQSSGTDKTHMPNLQVIHEDTIEGSES